MKLRVLVGICTFGLMAACNARPLFLDRFNELYKPASGSILSKAECKACHDLEDGPPVLNPYGMRVQELIDRRYEGPPRGGVTHDIMVFVEKEDSDGDGYSNLEEIVSGTLPGDPKSHPSQHPTNLPKHEISRKFEPLHVNVSAGLLLLGVLLGGGGKAAKKAYMKKLGLGAWILGSLATLATGGAWFLSNRHP